MAGPSYLATLDRHVLSRILGYAATPTCLARLEAALGVHAAEELRSHDDTGYHAVWLRVLSESLGLWHSAVCKDSRNAAESPSLRLMKRAVPIGRFSRGLEGGWHDLSSEELETGVPMLRRLDSSVTHEVHSSRSRRRAVLSLDGDDIFEDSVLRTHERLLFAHFDIRFGADCGQVLSSFRNDERREVAALSSSPTCPVGSAEAPFAVRMSSSVGQLSTGLEIELDTEGILIPARGGGDNDGLCVRCMLFCGGHRPITSEYALRRFDSTGMMPVYRRWHGLYRPASGMPFCSFRPEVDGLLHIVNLELYQGSVETGAPESAPCWSESSWHVDEMTKSKVLRSAEWNDNLQQGTGVAPLVYVAKNEFAAKKFKPNSLKGAIVLVKRGGGVGFAQKALTARKAGAVGCVIFDADGGPLRCFMGAMGLEYQGTRHPDPGIPSVLVDGTTGQHLMSLIDSVEGAFARIALDHSKEALQRLPPEVERFCELAAKGEAIHMAVVINHAEVVMPC